jgi:hypothetical protein
VRNASGILVLNAADVRAYHNTFVDSPASFRRDQRSASGDLFGWHPATGPGVDEREGHVFVNNLFVAGEGSRGPLLRFEQPQPLCAKLPKPQATEVNGNVYVRPASSGGSPLLTWSPAQTATCVTPVESVDAFRTLTPGFETTGRQLEATPRAIFRSPELGHYQLLKPLPASSPAKVPADVLKILGWTEQETRTPGAYPFRPGS